MPDEQLEEGENAIHLPILFLRLTSSRFLVSLDPLDLRSLLITSTFIGNLIMFPLFPDFTPFSRLTPITANVLATMVWTPVVLITLLLHFSASFNIHQLQKPF